MPRQAHGLNAVRFPSAVLNVPEPLYFSQNKMSCPEQSQRGFCAGLKSASEKIFEDGINLCLNYCHSHICPHIYIIIQK